MLGEITIFSGSIRSKYIKIMYSCCKTVFIIESIKTKISNDGSVLLTELPFAYGESVEIIVKSYEDKQKYIKEIEDALGKIKKLEGMLPICCSCKKIRDDKGAWNQIEEYISDHSEAEFTHGMCPECIKNHYPGYYDD